MAQSANRQRKPIFISIRWRFILPLAIIITIIAMFGAYYLASQMASGFEVSEENILVQSSQSVANRLVTTFERQRAEAQRVAFTRGIGENIIRNDVTTLHDTLEPLARTADLDSIIITDPAGLEIAGVLRVQNTEPIDYSISTQFDLRSEPIVQAIIDDDASSASGLIQTTQGLMLFVAVPITDDGTFRGVALVGQQLATLVEQLRVSALTQLAIYDGSGTALYTNLELDNTVLDDLNIAPETVSQTLNSDNPVIAITTPTNERYRTLYLPFDYGNARLGILSVLVPDNVPFATAIGRQLSSVFAALLAGTAVFLTFVAVDRYAVRLNQVRATATALNHGVRGARTGMKASDEIGAVGAALDQFATLSQQREDQLRADLWRQRRERNYMLAVFESIPDGVIVQDRDGEVIMMNDTARDLLGTQVGLQNNIAQLYQQVPQLLGREISPGIYALGDPRQVTHAGKMIQAQAAALMTRNQQRIGTVMLVRDITARVQQDQARDALLAQLESDIQQPLADVAHQAPAQVFARDIARHAASLQKMIVSMRELTRYSPEQVQPTARPLLAETLLYAVANDWRQIAQAAQITLQVNVDENGHYVFGDESRLRLALGNIVDNAIKYTPAGGIIALEIKTVQGGRLHLRIRDNGVGFSDEDRQHAFMSFYRGTPSLPDGTIIHVPGMGQGLPITKQILEAHAGIIKIKSRLGIGSAIYVALPITSGTSYSLPLLENADMDGETVQLSDDVDVESIWQRR